MNAVTQRKNLAASVTIYLAMSLLIILVLICTVIESGRVNAIRAKVRGITYMGLDSVFSEYAKPVFEDYGVMMLWCKEEEFVKRLDSYLSPNIRFADSSLLPSADLYDMEHLETQLTESKKADEENGKLFEEQVYEYMKYYLAESAAENILAQADVFEQADKMKSFMDKISDHQDEFIAVERSVGRIKENVEKAQRSADDPANSLESMSHALTKYRRSGDEAFLNEVYIRENELIDTRYRLGDTLDTIGKETERYHENAQKAQAAVKELETELSLDQNDYSPEVYNSLQEELNDIRQKSGESEADFYRIEENQQMISQYQNKIASLDGLFPVLDADITEENAAGIQAVVDQYKDSFQDFNLSGLSVNYDTERTEKESADFLKDISNLFTKGVLEYVAPEYSKKKADISEVPSGKLDKSLKDTSENLLEAGVHKVIFSEYIKTHFGRYTEKKAKTALDYEAEYIFAGKSSDKANLQAVIDKIILLRTGCNLISIMTDGEKKAEAYVLAAAIIGFTGMPVLVKLMQMVILSSWALAESIIDAKILFQGDKVPVIKKPTEWNLSLTSVKHFSASSIQGSGSGHGFSYEDYLRALLLMENKPTQILRTMDVIQLNMMANENQDFRIEDCVMEAETNVKYRAAPLFVRFPFVFRHTGYPAGGYLFELRQNYAY